ncbi:hypothetical protein [Streptomyces goshikiensis]|uniref:hypothetical protein n=1 Tax=Streptomyces goshikiensis TaxID=1942 RepID=UPI00367F8375
MVCRRSPSAPFPSSQLLPRTPHPLLRRRPAGVVDCLAEQRDIGDPSVLKACGERENAPCWTSNIAVCWPGTGSELHQRHSP